MMELDPVFVCVSSILHSRSYICARSRDIYTIVRARSIVRTRLRNAFEEGHGFYSAAGNSAVGQSANLWSQSAVGQSAAGNSAVELLFSLYDLLICGAARGVLICHSLEANLMLCFLLCVWFSIAIMALASTLASASDPSQLQDFCVAVKDSKSAVFVNGKFCNDPKLATANDFFYSGLLTPRNTSNPVGSTVTPVNVMQIPGLNTLGVSLARIDFAPYGLNPPHTHPRGTEILVVLEGTLYVGFVTSNPDNRLFTKVLYPGDVFVFPQGLIHFQFNQGKTNAVALAGLSSQNPGVITIANAVFGSNPKISDDVLAKAFQVDKKVVDHLQAQFWWPNN
ncbi:hypothetical protein TEA_015039 [Camellia sinensis var. sinensis]|uniref:Cupin type-1 domain-containing protein n=1 Tax=Camellia sinensis var. sinensis TaxID=542762 RepID=A0A4S4E2E6_CAMSN|nr:hypothetical protein TEA_015039 [Camellia sinensis var. sinensis]